MRTGAVVNSPDEFLLPVVHQKIIRIHVVHQAGLECTADLRHTVIRIARYNRTAAIEQIGVDEIRAQSQLRAIDVDFLGGLSGLLNRVDRAAALSLHHNLSGHAAGTGDFDVQANLFAGRSARDSRGNWDRGGKWRWAAVFQVERSHRQTTTSRSASGRKARKPTKRVRMLSPLCSARRSKSGREMYVQFVPMVTGLRRRRKVRCRSRQQDRFLLARLLPLEALTQTPIV